MQRPLRIGTRGSPLARAQTDWVAGQLRSLYPDLEIAIEIIQTTGDRNQSAPFAAVGAKGMFVKEIEQALLAGRVDLGVHSLKDMPSELPAGLTLAAVPIREDPRDALLSRDGTPLARLPQHARVGTSSLRRQAQLRAFRPDLRLVELRGNLDTRLRKLDQGDYDAIVLACAGLNRLGLAERITEPLPVEISTPAAGQGALALEIRADDTATLSRLAALNHAETQDAVTAERGFLSRLEAGCAVPAGVLATLMDEMLRVQAMLAAPDGSRTLRAAGQGSRTDAWNVGVRLAEQLLAQGGQELISVSGSRYPGSE